MSIKMIRASRALRRRLLPSATTQTRTREKGVVHTTSPLTIFLNGDTVHPVTAHCLAHYTPSIGDKVFVDNVDGDLVLVGSYSS
jgi:hypothetical protein